MAGTLRGRRVAILAADGVERVELERPRQALDEAGAQTDLLSVHGGEIQARKKTWTLPARSAWTDSSTTPSCPTTTRYFFPAAR